METVCSGCLAGNRRLSQIQETQAEQMYFKIIDELQVPREENLPVVLCWECKSIINRFVKFKRKVKISHQTLQNSIKNKTSINESLSQSTLTLHPVYQINVAPNTGTKEKEKETIQDFKIETYWPSTNYEINVEIIKNEEDHDISNSDSETLAVIKKEKNKKQIKIKKRTDNEGSEDEHSNVENETLTEIKEEKIKKKFKIPKRKNGVRKKKEIDSLCYKEIILTEEEIEGERKLLSAQEEYIHSIYKCEKCILSFPNADDMKDHTDFKHDKTAKFKCRICECTFSNEVSFNYHTNRHIKRYECNKCKDRFATVRKAERHYESHEYFPSYKCDECQDHFGTKEEFEIHNIKIHKVEASEKIVAISKDVNDSQSEAYPCTVCSKTFKWKTSLRKHMEMHNIEAGVKRRPYCETCRLSFTTTSSLQKHMKTSSKHQVLLKLSKLPDQSASEAANIKPKKGAHCCPLCGHCYQFRGNLRRHMESHRMRANGSLVCAPCNRTFSSQATYQQHIKFSRSHVSEEDFQFVCTECGGRFVSKTRLRDHMDWEHLKRFTHVCDLCQKVFKSHTSLYLHRRVVHANAAHLCDHCGKGFATLTKLRAHVSALHLGKAAHTCSTCLARFSWSSCLARHIKTMHKNT